MAEGAGMGIFTGWPLVTAVTDGEECLDSTQDQVGAQTYCRSKHKNYLYKMNDYNILNVYNLHFQYIFKTSLSVPLDNVRDVS